MYWAPSKCSAHWQALHSLLMSHSHCAAYLVIVTGAPLAAGFPLVQPSGGQENTGERAGYFFPAPSLLGCPVLGQIPLECSSCWAALLQFQIPLGSGNSASSLAPSALAVITVSHCCLVPGCFMVPGQHLCNRSFH